MIGFEAALICLATAIYFEARGEPVSGQQAVAHTVMNRVADDRYPNTVGEVVKQGPTYTWQPDFPVRNRCQFSFYCDGKSDKPTDKEAWQTSMMVAYGVLTGRTEDLTEGATHYHATYVLPAWAETKTATTRIKDHVFYRWERN